MQEPHVNFLGEVSASSKWRVVYPTSHLTLLDKIRSTILVNAEISTNFWHQVDIPDTNDLVAIQLEGPFGTATIVNIYNDQNHSTTLTRSDEALTDIKNRVNALPPLREHYVIWAGDFNRHHPRWDEERNRHLFTAKALEDAQYLIDILDEHNLDMALPKDVPTCEVSSTKNWTRPDNVFMSTNALDVLVKCTTVPEEKATCMDHVPIDTTLDFPVTNLKSVSQISFNFRAADWEGFKDTLAQKMAALPPPGRIGTEDEFHQRVASLTTAILDTIAHSVPKSKPVPHSKRWWNKDLERMRKAKNKLNSISYQFRHDQQHPSHRQLRDARNKFTDAIRSAKQKLHQRISIIYQSVQSGYSALGSVSSPSSPSSVRSPSSPWTFLLSTPG
jgi:hypothetical protein